MKNYDPIKVGYAVIIALVSLYALYITSSFFYVLILSALFAYMIYPVYTFFLRFVKNRQISALIPIALIFLIIITFAISIVKALLNEVSKLLNIPNTLNGFASIDLRQTIGFFEPLLSIPPGELTQKIGSFFNTLVTDYAPEIHDIVLQISSNLTVLLVELIVIVILTYYLLVESSMIISELPNLFPEKELAITFLTQLNYIYHNLFNVYFMACFLAGVFGGIIYWFLGIPYPAIWGILTFLMALLPVVGSGTIYGTLALYYLILGNYFTAITLLVLGIIFLSIIPDFVIRPKLAKSKAAIHPALTLVAFAAPLFVIGPIGVVIGPLTYGFLLAAYRTRKIVFRNEKGKTGTLENQNFEDEKVEGKRFSEMISEPSFTERSENKPIDPDSEAKN